MRVRIAEPADAEALTALINSAFLVERFFLDGDRIDLDSVRALLDKGKFLVVDGDGVLAACAYLELRGETAYLGLLSVDPSRQRAGLGSALMAAAEDHCRKAGARFVDIQIVNVRQELPAFYRRLGYVENGTAPFPAEANPKLPCHFVKMSKALSAET